MPKRNVLGIYRETIQSESPESRIRPETIKMLHYIVILILGFVFGEKLVHLGHPFIALEGDANITR